MEEMIGTIRTSVFNFFPSALLPIFIILSLSFLIGLEREEHADGRYYNFGGVRTFPILGISGYVMAQLGTSHSTLMAVGLFIVGALLWLSYQKKLQISSSAGMTSEISGLFTFLLGALVFHNDYWEATALTVAVLLLLELKTSLERLAKKIRPEEIFTFTRFLLISAVILPIVPNRNFTMFNFNPFHTWLIVVAISGISYGAYILGQLIDSQKSLIASSILGGLYSSTSATVVLAKKSREDSENPAYAGAILIASSCMYLRLIGLLAAFNTDLYRRLWLPFLVLSLLALAIGTIWMKSTAQRAVPSSHPNLNEKNPLELQAAFVFAALFALMAILTSVTVHHLGSLGVFGLSFITGVTDVDPFVMSLTQSSGTSVEVATAAKAIIIATASNDLIKGIYAALLGRGMARKYGSIMLIAFGLLSSLALLIV